MFASLLSGNSYSFGIIFFYFKNLKKPNSCGYINKRAFPAPSAPLAVRPTL